MHEKLKKVSNMDRKEKKRDIATFAHHMKELMNAPLENVLATLDRDIRHFVYGRIAVLVKHNNEKPIGSIADIGAVVGVAFSDVVSSIIGDASDETRNQMIETVRHNFLKGFDSRFNTVDSNDKEIYNE